VFRLYHEASGGTAFWTEQHTGANAVSVEGGSFHVLLGSIAPLDPGQLTVDTYLGITVAGDEKMTPRELLTSVYHAVEASHLVTSNTGDVTADSGGIEINDENGWTLRIDGNELDSTDGLHLQKEHSDKAVAMYGNVDMKGNLVTNCGRVQIESSSVPLLFRETDQTGACSLWRMPLDSRHLRFDASQNGTDFGGYKTPLALYSDGSVSIGGTLDMNGHSVTNCGALVEANLQTPEDLAAERIERFEQGDVLCWSNGQLEKCSKIGSPLVVAVADAEGKPIVIGAEPVKVLGPAHIGDLLVSSNVPGCAMVAEGTPAPGTVIAKALENFDGEQGLISAMILNH
jgi:hypothetical protein